MTHSPPVGSSTTNRNHILETITLPRPRCPRCGNIHLRKYRSLTDQGDGTALSWVRCLDDECGYHFKVLQE